MFYHIVFTDIKLMNSESMINSSDIITEIYYALIYLPTYLPLPLHHTLQGNIIPFKKHQQLSADYMEAGR